MIPQLYHRAVFPKTDELKQQGEFIERKNRVQSHDRLSGLLYF